MIAERAKDKTIVREEPYVGEDGTKVSGHDRPIPGTSIGARPPVTRKALATRSE